MPSALEAVATAGLICGTLDGLIAIGLARTVGVGPVQMFQGIARGVLGPRASLGGGGTGAMGLGLHFLIAFGASAVYYAASRVVPLLTEQPILCGAFYGIAVHFFMQFLVVPLSAIGRQPFARRSFVAQLIVHMIVVGPSIAITIRHFSRV